MQTDFETQAAATNPLQGRIYADFSEVEKSIYLQSRLNLCGSAEAIVTLIRSVEHVTRHAIPGALVECGVWRGGNIEVMVRTLQHLGVRDRDVYLYDTFAGMPQPDACDDEGLDCASNNRATWEQHRTEADGAAGSDWMRAGVDLVRERLDPLGYPGERLHFVKGLVEDTIPRVMPDRIAILRLDTDFYRSTKHELMHLYPRLQRGGILIIDDYGAMPGSRRATDEFAAEQQTGWFLNRVDAHVRLLVKHEAA